jgi:5,10-methylenetetrahydromethanopterin reductase
MPKTPVSVGVMLEPGDPPELLRSRLYIFEEAGLDDVWLREDLPSAGGIAAAATALEATRHLQVGLGILPALARNPAYAAMELAALGRLHPGRVIAGIGHGMQDWVATAGARPASPLTALEEVLASVRRLLDGEEVTMAGRYVHLDRVKLDFPPWQRIGLLAGVRGPRSIRLAGRVCDGVILAEPLSAAYVRWARGLLDEAAARAGRGRPTVVAYTWMSVADDVSLARDRVAPMLTSGRAALSEPGVRRSLETLDFSEDLIAAIDAAGGQGDTLTEMLQPEWVDQLSVTGTPEDCARATARLAQAGADRVVMVLLPGWSGEQAMTLGRKVLPMLAAHQASASS